MHRLGLMMAAMLAVPAMAAPPSDEQTLARMMSGGPILDAPELAARLAKAAGQPLGSRDNPVRAAGPLGQRAYLMRLRCNDDAPPKFARIGNFGAGPFRSIVDGYSVDCGAAGPAAATVFMDLYHPGHVEPAPVPGFTIRP